MPSPPLVITNCVQIRLLYFVAGVGAFNVLHATRPSGLLVNQALANTLGTAIKSAWVSRLGTHANNQMGLTRVGVRDLNTANQPEYLDSGAGTTGTGVGDAMPPQNAICITLRTALSGKSFTGRVYLTGFIETDNLAAGSVDPALNTACVNFITDLSAALTASSLTLAVASRPAYAFVETRTWTLPTGDTEVETIGRGAARSGGAQPVTVIQARNTTWETQRRRNNGRGAAPTAFVEGMQQEVNQAALASA